MYEKIKRIFEVILSCIGLLVLSVGLSMKCYRLGKEKRTCLGERQIKGRIGK